ncbi:MAG: rhomboid family intramembrane serine protease [Bdellovibrionota bacterium]
MFPYADENPSRTVPFFVYLFLIINAAVFAYGELYQPLPYEKWVLEWGLRPKELMGVGLSGEPGPWLELFASPWLHANWLHLAGNLWFLWIFGDNVEDQLGHGRFAVFYLVCGFLATSTHVLVSPRSNLPLVGASGAIAGVLGAYLVFFPWHRIRAIAFFLIIAYRVQIRAFIFIGLWLVLQVAGQYYWAAAHGSKGEMGGVAYGAHLGGFVAGLLLAFPFSTGRPRPRKPPRTQVA